MRISGSRKSAAASHSHYQSAYRETTRREKEVTVRIGKRNEQQRLAAKPMTAARLVAKQQQ